jgi:hypothetical protein
MSNELSYIFGLLADFFQKKRKGKQSKAKTNRNNNLETTILRPCHQEWREFDLFIKKKTNITLKRIKIKTKAM